MDIDIDMNKVIDIDMNKDIDIDIDLISYL